MKRRRFAAHFLLVLLLLRAQPLVPATISVTGGPTGCTLKDAIHAANTDKALNWCPAGFGPDTIRLFTDVTLTSSLGSFEGPTGLPSVTTKITLEGRGHTVERSVAAGDFRLIHIAETGDLTLDNVSLIRGKISGDDASGGAIYNRGKLTLLNTTVGSSEASSTTTFAGGGAIFSFYGEVDIRNSRFGNNAAHGTTGGVGGALASQRDYPLQIWDSSFYNNHATGNVALGGAIWISYSGTISNSSISGNSVTATGSVAAGGGLYAINVAMTNSTVSGNSATVASGNALGGGVYAYGTIQQTTFHGNQANLGAAVSGPPAYYSPLSLSGSLFAISTGGHCYGDTTDAGGNMADNSTCGTVPVGLVGVDPVLDDNGGPTPTHALLAGSQAINAAGSCGVGTDQRGAGRMPPCDVGAFEWIGCDLAEIEDQTFSTDVAASLACHSVVVGPGVVIGGGPAEAGLGVSAGYLVTLRNGVEVRDNGLLTVAINPSLLP